MAMAKEHLFGMIALSADTVVSVALDVRYQYKVLHSGKDASGNDDAQSALSAWLGETSTITCTAAVNDRQFELLDGASETVGPGIATLYMKSTADADGVLKIVRVGTPTTSY